MKETKNCAFDEELDIDALYCFLQWYEDYKEYYYFLKTKFVPSMMEKNLIKSPEVIFELIEDPDYGRKLLSKIPQAHDHSTV